MIATGQKGTNEVRLLKKTVFVTPGAYDRHS